MVEDETFCIIRSRKIKPHPLLSSLVPQTPTNKVSFSLFLARWQLRLDEQALQDEFSAWGHIHCIEAWDGIPYSYLDARFLHMQYSVPYEPF